MQRQRREYVSGTRWGLWRWTFAPSGYLTRLHLIKTPFGALMLHWINGPDPESDMHDHPVSFLSLVLRGGYSELRREVQTKIEITESWQVHKSIEVFNIIPIQWWNYIRAYDRHRIVEAKLGTLTLCLAGPPVHEWGFYTQTGWMSWRDYNKKYKSPHRWSGWPGAWCLDCGEPDPFEEALAEGKYLTIEDKNSPVGARYEFPGIVETYCKEPGSKRHDSYSRLIP